MQHLPRRSFVHACVIAALTVLAGCGLGDHSNSDAGGGTTASPATLADAETGVFLDSEVVNIDYSTESLNGVTNGAGEFNFRENENITFAVGALELPEIPAFSTVTPADMGRSIGLPARVVMNVTRLLHTLDEDLDPRNGIQITDAAKAVATPFDFDRPIDEFAAAIEVRELIQNAGHPFPVYDLVSLGWAMDNLNRNLLSYGVAIDTDGDGISNPLDAFPGDPLEFSDIDEDGVGDRTDRFPFDPEESADSDFDGIGDNRDVYPNDPTRSGRPPIVYGLTPSLMSVGIENELTIQLSSEQPLEDVTVSTTVQEAPEGSSLVGQRYAGAKFFITPDAVGSYVFEIEATDVGGVGTSSDSASASNSAPVAVVDSPSSTSIRQITSLSGQSSYDPDGHDLSYAWAWVSRPAGSTAALNDETSEVAAFEPDAAGTYDIQLTVTDPYGESDTSTHTVLVSRFALERLAARVVDAAYRKSDDTLVMLGDDARVYVYDTASHETQVVTLNLPATTIAISPDGTRAAVGHDGFISHLDLGSTPRVIDVLNVSTDVFDIVVTDDAVAHAMPRRDQWENLRTVDLTTGEESLQSGRSVRAGTRIDLHPSGDYVYGANNGLSPSDIEKYDIRTLPVTYLYDSPYHGTYAMCGNLWVAEDGERIFTACGNVFRSSEIRANDMTWNGALPRTGRVQHLSHHGNEVVYIDTADLGALTIASYDVIQLTGTEALPALVSGTDSFATEGRFVFHKSDGTLISIVQAESDSGLLNDFALAFTPDEGPAVNVRPTAIVGADVIVDLGEEVQLEAGDSFDPEGATLSYAWSILTRPSGSTADVSDDSAAAPTFVPDVDGVFEIELVVSDGNRESAPGVQRIEVEDPANRIIVPLDFAVGASDYSRSLDRVVMASTDTNELVQYALDTASFTTVDLPAPGHVVTVSPDGLQAAIGHANSFSLVDLVSNTLMRTYTVTTDIADIELPGNGRAYVFPATGQWVQIRVINLATGAETSGSGRSVRSGTLSDLHPSGTYIYGADNGLSPSDIEAYDISTGTPIYVSDSPYHGDFSMCGNIWVTDDGSSLITRCGNVFNSSPRGATDMNYIGSLNVPTQIASASSFGDEIVVTMRERLWYQTDDHSTYVQIFEASTLGFVRRIDLPEIEIGTGSYASHGRQVFHDSTGSTIVVLMQLESGAGALDDFNLYLQLRP